MELQWSIDKTKEITVFVSHHVISYKAAHSKTDDLSPGTNIGAGIDGNDDEDNMMKQKQECLWDSSATVHLQNRPSTIFFSWHGMAPNQHKHLTISKKLEK